MEENPMKKVILLLVVTTFLAATAMAGGTYSVRATVTSGSGAIQAKLVPAEFTVPSGTTAVNLKCFRADPSSGWSSDRLCSVYSVTQGVDMKDANGNPMTSLPAGTYRFAVGGKPGAYGTYTYTITP